jgi:GTP-binding protein
LAVLLLDATASLTEQDERIAGLIHEAGRACIIAINKWDAIEKDTHTTDRYITHIRKQLNFLDYAPILTLSAKTGQRVDRLLELARFVNEQHLMRIKTSLLNQTLRDIMRKHSPPTRHGKPLKIKFMSQVGVRPPAFALFVNDPSRVHFAYLRHIKNRLRERFGLEGTPIVIVLRGAKHEEKR